MSQLFMLRQPDSKYLFSVEERTSLITLKGQVVIGTQEEFEHFIRIYTRSEPRDTFKAVYGGFINSEQRSLVYNGKIFQLILNNRGRYCLEEQDYRQLHHERSQLERFPFLDLPFVERDTKWSTSIIKQLDSQR